MKKTFALCVFAVLVSSQAFAAYVVVLRDGTRYKAKAKWTVSNGKALISLENGQTLQIDPRDIDAAKSEEINKLGLGDVNVIAVEAPKKAPAPSRSTLGDAVRQRQAAAAAAAAAAKAAPQPTAETATAKPLEDRLNSRLKDNFERAYDNVGVYEAKLTGTNRVVRAELTVDNEDKVFNALSATALLITRNALVDNIQIDTVELFMKTTNGGSSGRFQMNRADADAIYKKTISIPEYYVRKVIY
jgi:hypothetical protein